MPVIELPPGTPAEVQQKTVNDLQARGCKLVSIFLYWYEGVAQARTVAQAGRHVQEFMDPLSMKEKVGLLSSHPMFADLRKRWMEAVRKDFEALGGMRELEGDPKDATLVIEYEEPRNEFAKNIHRAFFLQTVTVTREGDAQSRPLDCSLWLTPKTVGAYDQNDWPESRRSELTAKVQEFKRLAESVPSNKPAPVEISDQALSLLYEITALISTKGAGGASL